MNVRHLEGHVRVADADLGGREVLLVGREVRDRVLEPVLDRAEAGPDVRDRGERAVDGVDVGAACVNVFDEDAVEVRCRRGSIGLTMIVSPVFAPTWKVIGVVRAEHVDAVELSSC